MRPVLFALAVLVGLGGAAVAVHLTATPAQADGCTGSNCQ
jgi:hypothetical protein